MKICNAERTAILLRGPASVGKSTVASMLRDKLKNAVLFDIDYFIRMFGGDASKKEDKYRAYDNCILLIKQFAKLKYSIIVEELFMFPEQVNYFVNALEKLGYEAKVFTLMATSETLIKRDEARDRKLGEKLIRSVSQRFRRFNPDEKGIDTDEHSAKQVVNKIYELSLK